MSDSIIETLGLIQVLQEANAKRASHLQEVYMGVSVKGRGKGPEEVRRASDDDAAPTSLGGEGGRKVGRRASDTTQFMKDSVAVVSP